MYIGLIATDWGGTAIELWSSPDSLAKCGTNKYMHSFSHEDVILYCNYFATAVWVHTELNLITPYCGML